MYYSLVGFVILFTVTYMQILPWRYKLWVLCSTYIFTIGLPVLGIFLYRRLSGLTASQLRQRKARFWPYIISFVCYAVYLRIMYVMHLPRFMCGIVVGALFIQGVCLLLNLRWKVSMHAAGAGGIIGALMAYSVVFAFNPVLWLCGAVLLDGMVMTSRMILRQHTLWQVWMGTLVGIVCGYLGIMTV
jgi:hypothetical protein